LPPALAAAPIIVCSWIKLFDESYQTHYYQNNDTGVTQWELPDDYFETPEVPVAPEAVQVVVPAQAEVPVAPTINVPVAPALNIPVAPALSSGPVVGASAPPPPPIAPSIHVPPSPPLLNTNSSYTVATPTKSGNYIISFSSIFVSFLLKISMFSLFALQPEQSYYAEGNFSGLAFMPLLPVVKG